MLCFLPGCSEGGAWEVYNGSVCHWGGSILSSHRMTLGLSSKVSSMCCHQLHVPCCLASSIYCMLYTCTIHVSSIILLMHWKNIHGDRNKEMEHRMCSLSALLQILDYSKRDIWIQHVVCFIACIQIHSRIMEEAIVKC